MRNDDLTVLLAVLRGGGGTPISYSIKDEFLTDASAPLTTPRTSEPIGTVTLVLPGEMSISGGKLVMTNATSRGAIIHSGNIARRAGRVLVARGGQLSGTTHNIEVGMLNTSNARQFHLSPRSSGGFITTNAAESYYSYIAGDFLKSLAEATYALMLHGSGLSAFELQSGTWTMLWREYVNSDANIRFGVWPWTLVGGNSEVVVDFFRVADLPAPFTSEWATAYAASPSGSYTGTADQILDITLTAPGSITTEAGIKYRVQDASNYWRTYFNTSGALLIDSIEAGVATNRGSVAGVISSGQSLVLRIIMYGNTQRIITGTVAGAWTGRTSVIANSTFATQTGIATDIGAGWTAANLYSYPRTSPQYAMLDTL